MNHPLTLVNAMVLHFIVKSLWYRNQKVFLSHSL